MATESRSVEEIVEDLYKIRKEMHYEIIYSDKFQVAIDNLDRVIAYFAVWSKGGVHGSKKETSKSFLDA